MKNAEHLEQVALFQWIAIAAKQRPELGLAFAIPNGGQRNIITATRLKAEGVKAGVPDIFLPVPQGGFNGLFIEMKAVKGRPSSAQVEYLTALDMQGYDTAICYGFEEAKDVIEKYLKHGGKP